MLVLSVLVASCSGSDDGTARRGAHFLHEWLDEPESVFKFESAEDVTWPNGCMGVEWPGRVCSHGVVTGQRLTYRTPDGQPQYVHANDTGDHVWAPIREIETTIVRVEGLAIEFDVQRGDFSRIGLLVPGTFVDAPLTPGSRVYVAASNATSSEAAGAPLVVIVGLK